jgi:threonine-phosphate decarboxylase
MLRPFIDLAPLFRHGGTSLPCHESAIDFSVNINPLGPPLSVLALLRDKLPGIARYPDGECAALTGRLAAVHEVAPNQIVVGNGSTELIYAIARACRPARIAMAEPTFTEYLRASLLVGAAVEHWLAGGSNFDLEPFDPGEADLVWLCNPNSPTGRLWPAGVLPNWISRRPSTRFVIDEAFLPFLEDEREHSLIAQVRALPNLIVLRSLTKLYAVPGLRLGYAVTTATLAQAIRSQLPAWSVNGLAQAAGLAAVADSGFLAMTRAWFKVERKAFDQALGRLVAHLEFIPSQANFSLLRLRHGSSGWLVRALAERGILIREASNFVGLSAEYLRVAMRTAAENERLIREMREAIAECKLQNAN